MSSATPVPMALARVDAAVAVHREQARHAEHAVGVEGQRVETVIVDAPVDDVDLARAFRGAHPHGIAAHEQVLALDQLDPHLLGQEGMLEVGAVVRPRRHDRHGRIGIGQRWRNGAQAAQQLRRIVRDRRDPVVMKQAREQAHHHRTVLEHVRHARRRAQIVLEHVELAFGDAHDVDPGDMDIDIAGHVHVLHLGAIKLVAHDLRRGNHAGLDDFLAVIDVVQEQVEGADALEQAGLQLAPLGARQNARDDVEGDQPLGAGGAAIDRKGDAQALEQKVGLLALGGEGRVRGIAQPPHHPRIGRTDPPVAAMHFIKKTVPGHRPHAAPCLGKEATAVPIASGRNCPKIRAFPRPDTASLPND